MPWPVSRTIDCAVAGTDRFDHQAIGDKPVDDEGDVAVGDEQEPRQVAHQHAFGPAVERGHDVEAGRVVPKRVLSFSRNSSRSSATRAAV